MNQGNERLAPIAVPLEMIKRLRAETGMGVMECRAALEQAGGDYEQALETLRAKALTAVYQRSERQASQGRIEVYAHGNGRIGVMVEINAETDFAAQSEAFRTFTHEIALQIAAGAPRFVREDEVPADVLREETEKASAHALKAGKAGEVHARMVAGQVGKFLDETVLLRQASIRDDKTTVAQLLSQAVARVGENIVIRRFVRWELAAE